MQLPFVFYHKLSLCLLLAKMTKTTCTLAIGLLFLGGDKFL